MRMQRPPAANQNENEHREPSGADTELLRLLIEQAVEEAMFALTPDGRIVSWNAGAQRLTGYSAADVIGQPFARLHTDEDRRAGRPSELIRLAQKSGRLEEQGWLLKQEGSRLWAHLVITALADA